MFIECIRHKTEKDFQHFLHGIGLEEAADMDSLSQLQEYGKVPFGFCWNIEKCEILLATYPY